MARLRTSGIVWVVGLAATVAFGDEPGRSPATLLPSAGLHFYLEADGLARHEAAWNASAAHDILVKTPTGSTVIDLKRQLLDQLCRVGFAGTRLTGGELVAFQEHLVARGFTLASYEDGGETSKTYVFNGLGDEPGLARFESLLQGIHRLPPEAPGPNPNPDLLEILGVPKAARAEAPRAEALRPLIHPSVLAITVEDRSFRLITLEALPFACLGLKTEWSANGQMNLKVLFHAGR